MARFLLSQLIFPLRCVSASVGLHSLAFGGFGASQKKGDENADLISDMRNLVVMLKAVLWLCNKPTTPTAYPCLENVEFLEYGGQTIMGHTHHVISVAFSHDNSLLASGSWDLTIKIWNPAAGGDALRTLTGHTNWVYSVAFSHDSSLLASGSKDDTIKIWNPAAGGDALHTLSGHADIVHSVAFSHDSSLLASGSWDWTIKIWNPAVGGNALRTLTGHTDKVLSVAFSHDSSLLASGSWDDTIKIWNPAVGGTLLRTLSGHTDWVRSVAFSHDSSLLASGSKDRKIKIWNPAVGGTALRTLTGHTDWVYSVAFSHDSSLLASGSEDDTIKIWNPAVGGNALHTLTGHTGGVRSVAFMHDSSLLASGSEDNIIKIWNPAGGEDVLRTLTDTDKVYSVAFSHDSSLLASGSKDFTIKIWNPAAGGTALHTLSGHSYWVYSVAFSHDSSLLASGSLDKKIKIWNPAVGGNALRTLTGHEGFVYSVAFSHDSSLLASGSEDFTIKIWNPAVGGNALRTLSGHTDRVYSVAFSHDSSLLASGSMDFTIKIWNPAVGGNALRTLTGHADMVRSVAFSHDSSLLASGSEDFTIKIWNPAVGGNALRTLSGHTDWVRSVAFSHDSSLLASGSWDWTIKIWNPAVGGTALRTLSGHASYVRSVAFSHDSSLLASGSEDDTIKIWNQLPYVAPSIKSVVGAHNVVLESPFSGLSMHKFECRSPGSAAFSFCEIGISRGTSNISMPLRAQPEACSWAGMTSGSDAWEVVRVVDVNCPAGQETNVVEGTCISCDATRYSSQPGARCSPCTGGKIDANRTTCTPCPENSNPDPDTGESCICKAGFYEVVSAHNSETSCLACPANALCTRGTTLATIQPQLGYWHARGSNSGTNNDAGKMLSCINDACCSSPGTDGCARGRVCAVGYTGHLCAQCEAGYGQSGGGECAKCPEETRMGAIAGLTFVLGLVVIFVFVKMTLDDDAKQKEKESQLASLSEEERRKEEEKEAKKTERSLPMLKLAYAYVTFNYGVTELGVTLPETLREFIGISNKAASAVSSVPNFACAVLSSGALGRDVFPAKLTAWMLLPPLLLTLEAVFLAFFYCVKKKKKKRNRSPSQAATNESDDQSEENHALRQKLRGWFITGSAVTFFALHGGLTTITFQAFSCMQVDAEGQVFVLSSDASFPCYDSSYYTLLFSRAVPMLLVYVLALPLVAAVYISRKVRRRQPHNLSFLSSGFNDENPDCYWFYVVGLREVKSNAESHFNVALSFVTTFFAGMYALQLILVAVILPVALVVQTSYKPFDVELLNKYEKISLTSSGILYTSTLAWHTELSETVRVVIAICLMILISLVTLILLVQPVVGLALSVAKTLKKLFKCCGRSQDIHPASEERNRAARGYSKTTPQAFVKATRTVQVALPDIGKQAKL